MTITERFSAMYRDFTNLDLNELKTIYSPKIEFIDPIAHHHGLSALEEYFANMVTMTDYCKFDIHAVTACQPNEDNFSYIINWTMHARPASLKKHIELPGISQLKVDSSGIYYHRDYYDVGQMVYEHIPVVGWLVKKIKGRLQS
ncbi:nuclear transport factor 2 family protein [Alteromonas aestuariivivens]|uniref:Nuclear transport factor 2 family protein n=1 Tax=Alteromonas aestuariivivens TaxID=1938339 RepID=A0A3D8MFV8_9ALTE|nr:nuclear transport factor 2 family protein [Alteromonas aestuariivivens]RDV29394.1 nuclear transport factor 2 family protein [Alteromonas aestuariivivens]